MSQYRRQHKKIHPVQADGSSQLDTKQPRPNSVLTGTGNIITQNVEKGNIERVVELIYLILKAKSALKKPIDTISAVRATIEKWLIDR